jgi:hypothetical protein
MPSHSLRCASFVAAIFFGAQLATADDDLARTQPQRVIVELKVIEVATEKLRNLGFDWSRIRPSGITESILGDKVGDFLKSPADAEQFSGFVKALEQNNLARTIAEPTLATLDGRPASLAIGDNLKLDVVPLVLGDGRIRLEYRIEVSSAQPKSHAAERRRETTSTPLRLDAALDLESGKATLVNHTRFHSENADGKQRESELLVFARVELLKQDKLPTPSRIPAATLKEVPRTFGP